VCTPVRQECYSSECVGAVWMRPHLFFPRSESNVFSQAAMILTSRWRCGHSSMSRARLSGTASLLRGFSYVVAGDGNPPMRFHLCAIETTLVTTRVAVGKDASGSGPVGPSQ